MSKSFLRTIHDELMESKEREIILREALEKITRLRHWNDDMKYCYSDAESMYQIARNALDDLKFSS